ncbi:MAG: hypothetical protein KGD59_03305 [Candidatus Heimdallarchaeota archaeon]|nr:hypothetical protein [Candidatus Heimdallarchaeota archaeon]MBY8993551.1 hypothetical protein [Candidatus Heimdallarchaeota archaeon]
MTYVPPEKKQRTGSFGDFIYVVMFYMIEGAFIIFGIPILMIAIGVIPVSMYLIITKGEGALGVTWPLGIMGIFMVLFQILAVQYFVKKYVLEPNKMAFGEWLRWKFSPTEIKKRRAEKIARSQKMDEWYDGMDRIHERKALIKEEQSIDMREEWFKETGDPEAVETQSSEESDFILGEIEEEKEVTI